MTGSGVIEKSAPVSVSQLDFRFNSQARFAQVAAVPAATVIIAPTSPECLHLMLKLLGSTKQKFPGAINN